MCVNATIVVREGIVNSKEAIEKRLVAKRVRIMEAEKRKEGKKPAQK